jgi:hypothetical protein
MNNIQPEVHTLTELQYAETGSGPWRIYVYDEDGFHLGGKWFRKGPMKYPDEEITKEEAYQNAGAAINLGREVRICDGGDMLVYHAKDGQVIHGEKFWEDLGFDLRKTVENADRMQLAKQGQTRSGLCIACHEPALPKCYSEAGRREYAISGMCEKCFDGMFSEDE